jgi:hypothetical protein
MRHRDKARAPRAAIGAQRAFDADFNSSSARAMKMTREISIRTPLVDGLPTRFGFLMPVETNKRFG